MCSEVETLSSWALKSVLKSAPKHVKTRDIKAESSFWCSPDVQNDFQNDLQSSPKTMIILYSEGP